MNEEQKIDIKDTILSGNDMDQVSGGDRHPVILRECPKCHTRNYFIYSDSSTCCKYCGYTTK